MTSKQAKQIVENYIRKEVKRKLNEEDDAGSFEESYTTWFTSIQDLSGRAVKKLRRSPLKKQEAIMIAQNIKIECDHIIELAKTFN